MFASNHLLRSLAIGIGWIALLSILPVGGFAAGNPVSVDGRDKPETFVQIGHTSSINSIDLSPDGKWLLSGSDDDSIKLWEAESGRLIRTFKDNENVEFAAFLPGGRSFFSLNWKGNVSVWDIRTGEKIREFALSEMSATISSRSASYDGHVLRAIVGLRLYNADMSRGVVASVVERPRSGAIAGHLGFAFGSRNALSLDGRLMLSSVRESASESIMQSKDKTLMLWEIATGRILATLSGHTDRIDVVTLSAGNRYALSGSRDKTVMLWDLKRGRAAAVFAGHQKAIEALAFSPDQKYILSGSRDNTMKLWSVDDEKEIRSFAHDGEVTFVRFSPDGRFALSGDDNGAIRYWDIQSGLEVKALKSHAADANAFAYSPDGKYLLTGSSQGQLRLWDAASGKMLRKIDAHRETITAVQFTPDGKYLLSASYDKTMKLWDRNDGQLKNTFQGHAGQVYKAVISPDGRYILSAAQGNDIRLWNLAGGAEMTALNLSGVYLWSIGFSADSRQLLIAHDQKKSGHTVRVLALDGREVNRYVDVAFGGYSGDGKYFLSREYRQQSGQEQKLFAPDADAKPEKKIRHRDQSNENELVDISTGKVLGRFGQKGAIVSVSVSAEPNVVLTRNRYDRDIRLWDVTSGKEIRRYPVHFGLLTYDGKKVIAPSSQTLQAFDTATGRAGKLFAGLTTAKISAMALSSKGGYAVTGDESGMMQFWDIGAGALLKTIKADERNVIIAVAFSPDNQYAATMARFGMIKIWNLRDGQKVSEFKTDYVSGFYEELEAGDYVNYGNGVLAFSPDGRHIACGPILLDAATGRKVLDFQTPNGPGYWVTFSPDGAYLLSKNMLWDAATGRRARKMESITDGTFSLFSADGKTIYAADYDGVFSVVDPDTGKLIRRYKDYISGAAFAVSRDQKMMLAADRDVSELTLWNLASGNKTAAITAHRNISSVELSADARRAMVNHRVSTAQYDLRAGKELAQFISFMDGEWIVITPEGYYNASAGGERYLNVRVGEQVYGIENYRETFFRPDLVKVALSGGSLADFRKLADVKEPPAVKIFDTPASVATDEVTVRLSLTDQGGGIGDIRLYLNGTAVVMDSRAVQILGKTGQAVLKSYDLKLVNGKNTIKAVAMNGDNSMQSNEAALEVTANYAQAGKPSLSALVIGINQFKNPKLKLQYSAADADLFAATLQSASEGLFDRVTIKKLIKPEETTNDAILREIKSFQSLRPDDLFVFYIASHGTVDEGEYFLITSNVGSLRTEKLKTDAISQNKLKEAIANIPATKKLIIIDTCNAGALGEAIQVAMLTRGMSEDTALKILSRAVGSTILSASTSLQEALEGYRGHGLFTYVLAEGLRGKADKGKTGYIKTTDLADYVDNEVPLLAEKTFKRAQYPTISISGQAFPVGKVK
ncbi:MAG: caspase family protein [Deltaproteobacteria bacterium]